MANRFRRGVALCLAAALLRGCGPPPLPAPPTPPPPLTCSVVGIPGTLGVGRAYSITVTNHTSWDGTNIALTATLAEGWRLHSAHGPTQATQAGQVVRSAPLARLAPKAKVTYTVVVKDAAGGNGRFEVTLASDQMVRFSTSSQ